MSKDQSRTISDSPSSSPLATVESSAAGLRLDAYLARKFPGYSRNKWKELIAQGLVLINGRSASKSVPLQSGWTIQLPPLELTQPTPEQLANPELAARITILYRDTSFLAVAKPAGLPTHPLQIQERETLFNALVALDAGIACAGPKPLEGGLIHRLDVQTSGVLLAASTRAGFTALRQIFSAHQAEKTYLALIVGTLTQDIAISAAIAHAAHSSKRMVAIVNPTATTQTVTWRGIPRAAVSEVHVLQVLNGHTLVEVRVRQAQMHQIRVHLQAIGHPLAGDAIYHARNPTMTVDSGLDRHALHAASIELPHPETGTKLHIEAPLPADMVAAILRLGGVWPQ